jgi:hypothetical protein
MSATLWSRNLALAHACPRCGARTRAGAPCRAQAMRNGRCYRHVGPSAPAHAHRKAYSALYGPGRCMVATAPRRGSCAG